MDPHSQPARPSSPLTAPLPAALPAALPALREWAATCAAVEAGRQLLLIRKGGISEPEFTVESRRFALLPTLFHQTHGTPPPVSQVEVRVLCELVATLEVASDAPLHHLARFHAYEPDQLATRVAYKPEKPLTLLAIRPLKLRQPLPLDLNAIRPVCRSWLEIPAPAELACDPIATAESIDSLVSLWEAAHAA